MPLALHRSLVGDDNGGARLLPMPAQRGARIGDVHASSHLPSLTGTISSNAALSRDEDDADDSTYGQRARLIHNQWQGIAPSTLKRDILAFTPAVVHRILDMEQQRENFEMEKATAARTDGHESRHDGENPDAGHQSRDRESMSSDLGVEVSQQAGNVWPVVAHANCSLMLADVSGFCKLTEEFCAQGADGLDKLQSGINQCFSTLMDVINAYGGDVLHFAGDALIIGWFDMVPCEDTLQNAQRAQSNDGFETARVCEKIIDFYKRGKAPDEKLAYMLANRRRLNAIAATRCGLELAATKPRFHDRNLALHVAVASGPLHLYIAGSEGTDFQFMAMGPLFKKLGKALDKANACELVVDSFTAEYTKDFFSASPTDYPEGSAHDLSSQQQQQQPSSSSLSFSATGSRDVFYQISSVDNAALDEHLEQCVEQMNATCSPTPPREDDKSGAAQSPDIVQKALMFVPPPLEIDVWSQNASLAVEAEIRDATVIFVKLDGPRIQCALDSEGVPFLHLIDEIVSIAQLALRDFEAMLRQFLVDDKGMVMIFALGVPKCAHFDDPKRGLKCATKFCQDLSRIDVHAYAGVTSGQAYSGTVGNARRKEFALVGNTVNMAARLMSFGFKSANAWKAKEATSNETKRRHVQERVRAPGEPHRLTVLAQAKAFESSRVLNVDSPSPQTSFAPNASDRRDKAMFSQNWCVICDEMTHSRCDTSEFQFHPFHGVFVKGMSSRKSLYGVTPRALPSTQVGEVSSSHCVGFDNEFASIKLILRTRDMQRRFNVYGDDNELAAPNAQQSRRRSFDRQTPLHRASGELQQADTNYRETDALSVQDKTFVPGKQALNRSKTAGGGQVARSPEFDEIAALDTSEYRINQSRDSRGARYSLPQTKAEKIQERIDRIHRGNGQKDIVFPELEPQSTDGEEEEKDEDNEDNEEEEEAKSAYSDEGGIGGQTETKEAKESEEKSSSRQEVEEKAQDRGQGGGVKEETKVGEGRFRPQSGPLPRVRQMSCVVDYGQASGNVENDAMPMGGSRIPRKSKTKSVQTLHNGEQLKRSSSRLPMKRSSKMDVLEQRGGSLVLLKSEEGGGRSALLRHAAAFAATLKFIPIIISLRPEDHYQPYSALSKIFEMLVKSRQGESQDVRGPNQVESIDLILSEWKAVLNTTEMSASAIIETSILSKTEGKGVGWDEDESSRNFAVVRSALVKLFLTKTMRQMLSCDIVIAIDDMHCTDTCSWDILMTLLTTTKLNLFIMGTVQQSRKKNAVAITPTSAAQNAGSSVLTYGEHGLHPTRLQPSAKQQAHRVEYLNTSKIGKLYTIVLPRLRLVDIEIILRERFPEKEWPLSECERVYEVSRGHPFLAIEIARGLVADPSGLDDDQDRSPLSESEDKVETTRKHRDAFTKAFVARLDGLSTAEQRCLKAASVIGPLFDYDTLADILPRSFLRRREDEMTLLDAVLDLLVMESFIRLKAKAACGESDLYEFVHPKLQQACYSLLLRADQITLHKQVASWIARVHQDDLRDHYVSMLYHLLRADAFDKAMDYAVGSVEAYIDAGAFTEAHALLVQISALVKRDKLKGRTLRMVCNSLKQFMSHRGSELEDTMSGSQDTGSGIRQQYYRASHSPNASNKARFLYGDDTSESSAGPMVSVDDLDDSSYPDGMDFITRVFTTNKRPRQLFGRFFSSATSASPSNNDSPAAIFFAELKAFIELLENTIRGQQSQKKATGGKLPSRSNNAGLPASDNEASMPTGQASSSHGTRVCLIQ